MTAASAGTRAWRRLFAAGGGAAALAAAYVGLPATARHLLAARTPLGPADAIVVLGGDAESRPDRAAALYRAGLAPRVIVSGDGDCRQSANRLHAGGVGVAAILYECRSGNTAENAAYSTALLRALGARSVIVVTSWWHTARALRCFERSAPDLAVMVAHSAEPPSLRAILRQPAEREHIWLEYLKSVFYRLPGVDRCRRRPGWKRSTGR